ncbi:hypothetical protein [Halodesulfovibrio sp.]|jgi:hypothetical protein|uniref:hypothetical protein n=1 Tax=Halodesulfovibrio sp. TaxID=1912772 RepID=UPI0025D924DC|nr:hypothetical protein [Halodesulfovibrio sp.]MCT4534301.1 hypothetical protein [Halodesulfovibrio sp.]
MCVIPNSICPHAALRESSTAASEVFKAIIVRSNFIPEVRLQLGWRGVSDCSFSSAAWTMKIAGYSGVFGIRCGSVLSQEGLSTGVFPVSYFPDPNEKLVDNFSAQAGMITRREKYKKSLCKFVQHAAFCDAFTIGTIHVSVLPDGSGVSLGIESASQFVSVAVDGVRGKKEHTESEVVPAGGVDQNLPAWGIAYDFFRVLAASTSFCFQRKPDSILKRTREGRKVYYTAAGSCYAVPDKGGVETQFILQYGEVQDSTQAIRRNEGWRMPLEVVWQKKQPIPEKLLNERWWQLSPETQSDHLKKADCKTSCKPRLSALAGLLEAGKVNFVRDCLECQITCS